MTAGGPSPTSSDVRFAPLSGEKQTSDAPTPSADFMSTHPRAAAPALGDSTRAKPYLIRKSCLVSFVPFISSLIHTGVTPRPVHLRDLFFLD